jgi:hypothetical protein
MDSPDFKKATRKQLHQWKDGNQGWSDICSGAKAELDRRDFWCRFFTYGIVAWLSLILSIISLCVSFLHKK